MLTSSGEYRRLTGCPFCDAEVGRDTPGMDWPNHWEIECPANMHRQDSSQTAEKAEVNLRT